MVTHKLWIYKIVSRSEVNKNMKQNFIKIVLTKDLGWEKKQKERMRIRKSGYFEFDWTHYYIEKFNIVLSLYRVLGIALYFSKKFLKVAATWVL